MKKRAVDSQSTVRASFFLFFIFFEVSSVSWFLGSAFCVVVEDLLDSLHDARLSTMGNIV